MTASPQPVDRTSDPAPEHRADAAPAEPPRMWWQFSLRTMFILVTLLVIGLAWFVNGPEKQRRVVATIEARNPGNLVFQGGYEGTLVEAWLPRAYYDPVIIIDAAYGVRTDDLVNDAVHLSSVKSIFLDYSDITAVGIKRLAAAPSLEVIDLTGTAVDDECLAELKRLPRLHIFSSGQSLTDAGLAHIGEMSQLDELKISGDKITDAGMVHIGKLSQLKALSIWGDRLTDAALTPLAKLTNLERLYINCSGITDEGLAHLRKLSWLQTLSISDAKLTSHGLANLGPLESLQNLRLTHMPLEDSGLIYLRQFPSLTSLDLTGTNVTDAALDHVIAIPTLKQFDFDRTKITPFGMARWSAVLQSRERAAAAAENALRSNTNGSP